MSYGIYQWTITAYRDPDRAEGENIQQGLIDSISHGVVATLIEVITLRRSLKRRAVNVLTLFALLDAPDGPPEAINGRPPPISASWFRNLSTYVARGLFKSDGFRPLLLSG